jgi:hypothetical protein
VTNQNLPPDFLDLLRSVTARRPRTVIDHILQHGYVTTEELRDLYGYNHPPRGARDVREQGIPLETFRVIGSDGRWIAAYRFGDPSEQRSAQLSGRTTFSSRMKDTLTGIAGSRCNIYLEFVPAGELQIDHRVPFEIAGGDSLSDNPDDYMLLCSSANRAKSWSCEHCDNWQTRDANVCRSCYWAFPEGYSHVAMRDIRRLDIMWSGDESVEYERLNEQAVRENQELPDFVKSVLRLHLERKSG